MDVLYIDGWYILYSEIAAYRYKEQKLGYKPLVEIILKGGIHLEGYSSNEELNKILDYWSKHDAKR